MNPKLQKTVREIERAKAQIAGLQALLPELERQKTELENSEIVKTVRAACVAPGDLETFLAAYRAELAGRSAPKPARGEPARNVQTQTGTEAARDDG